MTDLRKAAEMALEALERCEFGVISDGRLKATIQTLRQALAQEGKPPVKSYCGGKPNYCTPVDAVNISQECVDETAKGEHEPIGEVYGWHGIGKGQPMCRFNASEAEMPVGTKLYTAPPKREWVGLTVDEVFECWKTGDVVAAVEAKLKEKNSG